VPALSSTRMGAGMKWREISERRARGSTKPLKPLSPPQARKRSEKQARIGQQISDARSKFNQRVSDLQTRMATAR
jgi:hypothetical protein